MRETLFRGKRKDNGEWVEGFFLSNDNKEYILTQGELANSLDECELLHTCWVHEVDPETVGLFTGSYDKNERCIFEGDLVELRSLDIEDVVLFMEIVHCNGTFGVDPGGKFFRLTDLLRLYEATVVGNVHDAEYRSDTQQEATE
jgi:uncharacterized phage protein (TIGR01671 family)